MKKRISLDIIAFLLLMICMEYHFTGSLLHEILGFVLFFALIIHIAWNYKYYKAMFSGKLNLKTKTTKLVCVLNILLPISLIIMILSSCAISKELLSSLEFQLNNYEVWHTLHILSACTLVVTSFIHMLMHIKLFKSLSKKVIERENSQLAAHIAFITIASVMGIYLARNTVHYFSKEMKANISTNESTNTDSIPVYTDITTPEDDSEDKDETEITSNHSNQNDTPTLEEYLEPLICHGCGRRCSLLSPQCGKGARQAQEAEKEYNQTYYSDTVN